MKHTLIYKFDKCLLGEKKVKIIYSLLSLFLVFLLINPIKNHDMNSNNHNTLYFYSDVVLPFILSYIGYLIFSQDYKGCTNNILMIYGKKRYNAVLLNRFLLYIVASSIMQLIYTLILTISIENITFGTVGNYFLDSYNFLLVFFKSYPNTIFLLFLSLLILKITREKIFVNIIMSIYILEELLAEGAYTYPFSLFINYNPKFNYDINIYILNRSFFILISILIFIFLITKTDNV